MESNEAVKALGALAQETRLAAFRILVEAGPDGMAAGALAESLDIAAPTLSFHLAALAQAGLVTSARDGRSIVYAAEFGAMRGLVDFLTENCCGGGAVRCAPPPRGRTSPRKGARK
jgi:DNA-binding transcriptional ArsR family regulator